MKKRVVKWILFILSVILILWLTLLRTPGVTRRFELRLFWSYRELFAGDPNWKQDVLQNIQNILLFIPFGLFIPLSRFRTVLIIAFSFSVAIEAAQWIWMLGLAEIDDVICNVAGAGIGFGLMTMVRRFVDDTGT